MAPISKILGYASKLFTKSSTQVAKTAPKVEQKGTEVLTDLLSGTQTLKREITYAGKKATATVETKTLENGAKQTRLSIEGGRDNPMWRTKTVTREKGTSVFGGDKITVETDYTKYWCHGKNSTLRKEYNPQGRLEHTDLNYTYQAGNGLGYAKHHATQDRIYAEASPTHSVKKMLENPSSNDKVMHSLDNHNNYNNFQTKETPYEKTIRVKKEQAIAEAKKAEEAKKATELAAQKAAKELEAKMPRINTSKIFGLNANELKMVEKVHEDGSITRYFFKPETGKGNRIPVIKTRDKGRMHEEWINESNKGKIYIKEIRDPNGSRLFDEKGLLDSTSNDDLYVVLKKYDGKEEYTQIYKTTQTWDGAKTIDHKLYFNNGNYKGFIKDPTTYPRTEILLPYKEDPMYKIYVNDKFLGEEVFKRSYGVKNEFLRWHVEYNELNQLQPEVRNFLVNTSKKNTTDIESLIKPYQP